MGEKCITCDPREKKKDSGVQYSPITPPKCYSDLTNYPLKYHYRTGTHSIPWQNQGNKI